MNNTLVFGLGNPGKQYEFTRHNVGHIFINEFCKDNSLKLKIDNKLEANYCILDNIIFGCAQSYMNTSGKSIKLMCKYYDIIPENVFIIHDEVEEKVGTIKLRFNLSDKGHNGLKSITEQIGKNYYRLGIGVGKKQPLDQYVLSNFNTDEFIIISQSIDKLIGSIRSIVHSKCL